MKEGLGSMSKTAYKEEKRKKILEYATQCLAEKPNASLNEIAQYAQIGIATLHRYFSTREDLITAISYRALELVNVAIIEINFSEPNIRTFIKQTAEVLMPIGDRIFFLFSEVFNTENSDLDNIEKEIIDKFIEEFKRRQNIGQLRKDLKAEWMFYILYSVIFISWKEIHDGNIACKDAPEQLTTTLLDGFIK